IAQPACCPAHRHCCSERRSSLGWARIFPPSMVMEATAALRHHHEAWHPEPGQLDKVLRSSIGFNAGQWYPQANPQGIIPRFSFGSAITNPPDVTFDDRFLTGGTDFTFSFNDNVTMTRGAHTIKLGVSVQRL